MDEVAEAEYEEVGQEGPGFPPNLPAGFPVAATTATEVVLQEQNRQVAVREESMSLAQLVAHVGLIQDAMKAVMRDGEHYGVIPGTNKPTLLKPGAETLCLLFRLAPKYEVVRDFDGDHLTVWVTCNLVHIPTGNFMGSGEGSCSTKESRYAYRNAKRKCPVCNNESVIKGKAEYGGGWLCWKKSEPVAGCGAKFPEGDQRIESQEEGKVDNDALPDLYNTVVKMGCKRALVAGVLNATAASDIFTQDMEGGGTTQSKQATDVSQPHPESKTATSEPAPQEDTTEALTIVRVGLLQLEGKPGWSESEIIGAAASSFRRPITSLEEMTLRELREVYKGMVEYGGLEVTT